MLCFVVSFVFFGCFLTGAAGGMPGKAGPPGPTGAMAGAQGPPGPMGPQGTGIEKPRNVFTLITGLGGDSHRPGMISQKADKLNALRGAEEGGSKSNGANFAPTNFNCKPRFDGTSAR